MRRKREARKMGKERQNGMNLKKESDDGRKEETGIEMGHENER